MRNGRILIFMVERGHIGAKISLLYQIKKLGLEEKVKQSLTRTELEVRGLALFGLLICPKTPVSITQDGSVQIHLVKLETNNFDFKRVFRKGKLVTLNLDPKGSTKNQYSFEKLSSTDPASAFNAIIEDIFDENIILNISSFDATNPNFIQTIRSLSSKHSTFVFLTKRSEKYLFKSSIQRLKKIRRWKELRQGTNNGIHIVSSLSDDDSLTDFELKSTKNHNNTLELSDYLDDSKLETLNHASKCPPLHLIHGPPGTGKTTSLASIVISAVANDERVLALAPSHAACDALTMSIYSQIINLPPLLRTKYFNRKDVLVREAKKQRLTNTFVNRFLPEEIYENSNSDDDIEIVNHAWKTVIDGNWQNIDSNILLFKKEISKLFKKHKILIERAKKESSIFVTTIASTSLDTYKKYNFDLVCIDEAGFVSQGNSLLHILRAPRIILCGDHCQLPPITFNPDSALEGYEISAMEKLTKLLPNCVSFLSIQYRSNQIISEWSSRYIYYNKLRTSSTVANITLQDLIPHQNSELNRPFVFIDTKGQGYHEEQDEGSEFMTDADKSIVNLNEAFLVEIIVNKYIELGVSPKDMGIISPYWSQVSVLRSLIWKSDHLRDISIYTVDSFQGKEKEMIIISFVRSNPYGEIGFLRETRRINVSVTRARRCVIIVGDSETLCHDPALKDLVDFCSDNELIVGSDTIF
ncbi:DNA-binding protein SMUBP-2 isoform X2 [Lepeophtheirus salmonis]|uniref:DNA-binding protein SMUBP-2 isoform X2 n=1 Tax=Lepeophtheirus salmonis TaxID=72036 RepID=UPI001AE9C127|nr:DNA-binding protein SMUBP-2-like isoform X2 [Lepeophtheirus salmonis]